MSLPEGWKLLTKDTDCTSCHYTIKADNEEGMFFVGALPFCDHHCHKDWSDDEEAQVKGVDSTLSHDTICIKKEGRP